MMKAFAVAAGCLALSTVRGASVPLEGTPLPVIPTVRSFTVREDAGFCDVETAKLRCETSAAGYGEDGYRMDLTPDRILVSAGGRTGIVRAKATVGQLRAAAKRGVKIPCGKLDEMPKCRERGIVLDGGASRSLDFLRRLVRAMRHDKLNLLCVRGEIGLPADSASWKTFVADSAKSGVRVLAGADADARAQKAVPVRSEEGALRKLYDEWEPEEIALVDCGATADWEKLLPVLGTVAQKAWTGKVENLSWTDFRGAMESSRTELGRDTGKGY